MPIEPGLNATIAHTVADADTALVLKSGDVPVLGTPKVLALVEEASVAALSGHLGEGETSVGSSVQLDHLAPTLTGTDVTAEATLAKVEGRRLIFVVRVTDARGLIAAGKVTRAVVKIDRFLSHARGTDG